MSIPKPSYSIHRHDQTTDKSLKPYSAADEYLLHYINNTVTKPTQLAIYNDRFGFLSCHLHAHKPSTIISNKSQEKAIQANCQANNLPLPHFTNPLSSLEKKIDLALVKAPKSLALLKLYLEHISQNSTDDVVTVIAFMTRHFSSGLLETAQKYFEHAEQSRAIKKARLAILTKKKVLPHETPLDTLHYKGQEYQQYWGVFSAKQIDYATQYFLEHLVVNPSDQRVLDLASGNGVIGSEILKLQPTAEMHLMDDAWLAVESAKLNVQGENIHHHFNNNLSDFKDESFDLIVTNPPFHFEYEVNINVALQLFKACYRCLKAGGNLQIVANKHLNYFTHLKPLFVTVEVVAQNDKFVVYKCVK